MSANDKEETIVFLIGAVWICLGLGFALHSFWWAFAIFPIAFKVMSWREPRRTSPQGGQQ